MCVRIQMSPLPFLLQPFILLEPIISDGNYGQNRDKKELLLLLFLLGCFVCLFVFRDMLLGFSIGGGGEILVSHMWA
jgi:hypothetical protein